MYTSKLDEYDFNLLIRLHGSKSKNVICNIPTKILINNQLIKKYFLLTEEDAAKIFAEIIEDAAFLGALSDKAQEADKTTDYNIADVNRDLDQNQIKIEQIVNRSLPDAPASISFWFSRLAYDYVRNCNS